MQTDKTTLRDLSVFSGENSNDLFSLLDHTVSSVGREVLRKHMANPPDTYEMLIKTRDAIRFLAQNPSVWPTGILNGTIVMLERYFESAEDQAIAPGGLTLLVQTWCQSFIKNKASSGYQFNLSHLADFFKGCTQLAAMANMHDCPDLLKTQCNFIAQELNHKLIPAITGITAKTPYSELVQLDHRIRRELKHVVHRLLHVYAYLDALHAMAVATNNKGWIFPALSPIEPVCMEVSGLWHPLLQNPVSYDIDLRRENNFLILTGANMSGKTTFLRALGVSAYLAHLGMGVPAAAMEISYLGGVITNMHVEDNILKGESYFFAEVLRMKMTAEKIGKEAPHLLLLDELFKGTNVHDAYECTLAVIEGLRNHNNHLIVLSTHLYEVARRFEDSGDIQFAYFITQMDDDAGFNFTYHLAKGISNDRIGYRILQKEGVLNLLLRKKGDQ